MRVLPSVVKNQFWFTLSLLLLGTLSQASAQLAVAGTLVEERRADLGVTYGGVLTIKNASALRQEARLYQTDYIPSPNGTSRFDDPGSNARSNARWVSVASRVVIPPGQSVDVPYNVAVPASGPNAGTYWSIVMIETVPPGSPESSVSGKPNETQVGLVSRFRTAVQIVTNVGAQQVPSAKFEEPKIQAADTLGVLQFDLRNTGMQAFRTEFKLELYTAEGTHVRTLKATRGLNFPGLAQRQRFNLGRLTPGRYRAVVTADIGGGTLVGARYNFGL